MVRRVMIGNDQGVRPAHARRAKGELQLGDIVTVAGGSRAKVVAIDERRQSCLVIHRETAAAAIYPLQQVRRVNAWWNEARLRSSSSPRIRSAEGATDPGVPYTMIETRG